MMRDADRDSKSGAVVVNFNDGVAAIRCVEALLAQRPVAPSRVVIVDNASRDDSHARIGVALERWNRTRERVRWLPLEENVGFARGVNRGAALIDSPYLLVLNPDVEMSPNALATLEESLELDPLAAIAAPLLLNHDLTRQTSVRRHYTVASLLARTFPFNRLALLGGLARHHLMLDAVPDESRAVDWAVGACLLVRRAALDDPLRPFDERYFLYFEDVDLALAVQQRGYRVVYQPRAVALHAHRRASAALWPSRAKLEHFLSLVRFLRKHPHYLSKGGQR